MRGGALLVLVPLVVASPSCAVFDADPLSPFGEALIVVDTDLQVPQLASRLRVDLHEDDGALFATRDDVRPDPRDWPTSFSVFTDDTARGRVVLVRLRAYLEGRITAAGDPDPSLAVDRLVRVRLEPGHRGRVVVTLRGGCAGLPASLEDRATCTEGGVVEPLTGDSSIEEGVLDRAVAVRSAGTFGLVACEAPTAPGRVCVPGGAFLLGDRFYRPSRASGQLAASPERIVQVSRFEVDANEVTVARYRAALGRGFAAPVPVKTLERDGAPGSRVDDACTFSANPRGREDYALSCTPWVTADAFCRFEGGLLPTEAQWEYAALAVNRSRKAIYPWGDDTPSCDRAVYGRSALSGDCLARGEGPQLPNAAPGDVTPLGVHDLGGGFEEHTRDAVATFDEPCWTAGRGVLKDPVCAKPVTKACQDDPTSLECRASGDYTHITRGGSWASFGDRLLGISRDSAQAGAANELVGFRCVYPLP